MKASFNLLYEPWIIVLMADGTMEELSVCEVFERAGTIRRLANETITQDFAILRLLLAILYRSVTGRLDGDENPIEVWGDWWSDGDPDFGIAIDYLGKWADRFDLLDESTPFMQTAELSKVSGGFDEVKKVIADHPDNLVLFSMRARDALKTLTFAEGARWLVHVQAYDTAGIKSGTIGDSRAEGSRVFARPPLGIGWAGKLGGVFLEGDTLAKTLALNLVLCDGRQVDELMDFENDLPVWERTPQFPDDRNRIPQGTVDLFTWQSRRVRLVHSGSAFEGVVLTYGDAFEPYNLQRYETMTCWRRRTGRGPRTSTRPIYDPLRHDSNRALWRGLNSLLPRFVEETEPDSVTAGVVRWAGDLANERLLDPSERITMHAVGVVYNKNGSSKIEHMISDSLRMSLFLISERGHIASEMVLGCLEATDRAVRAYGTLAKRLELASGSNPKQANAASDSAKSEAYFELDSLFRAWVIDIDGSSDLAQKRAKWHCIAWRCLMRLHDILMQRTGSQSILGRKIVDEKQWVGAGGAECAFFKSLKKALPYGKLARNTGNEEG